MSTILPSESRHELKIRFPPTTSAYDLTHDPNIRSEHTISRTARKEPHPSSSRPVPQDLQSHDRLARLALTAYTAITSSNERITAQTGTTSVLEVPARGHLDISSASEGRCCLMSPAFHVIERVSERASLLRLIDRSLKMQDESRCDQDFYLVKGALPCDCILYSCGREQSRWPIK